MSAAPTARHRPENTAHRASAGAAARAVPIPPFRSRLAGLVPCPECRAGWAAPRRGRSVVAARPDTGSGCGAGRHAPTAIRPGRRDQPPRRH